MVDDRPLQHHLHLSHEILVRCGSLGDEGGFCSSSSEEFGSDLTSEGAVDSEVPREHGQQRQDPEIPPEQEDRTRNLLDTSDLPIVVACGGGVCGFGREE